LGFNLVYGYRHLSITPEYIRRYPKEIHKDIIKNLQGYLIYIFYYNIFLNILNFQTILVYYQGKLASKRESPDGAVGKTFCFHFAEPGSILTETKLIG